MLDGSTCLFAMNTNCGLFQCVFEHDIIPEAVRIKLFGSKNILLSIIAASQTGREIEMVLDRFPLPEALSKDQEFAKAAVSSNGLMWRHFHESIRSNKEVGFLAVRSNGISLKFAMPPLSVQDVDLLNAAKLMGTTRRGQLEPQLIMSVKFSLKEEASPLASKLMIALQEHHRLNKYKTHFPNSVSKSFCGEMKNVIEVKGHCFGLCRKKCCKREGCKPETSGSSPPTPCSTDPRDVTHHSCWAYDFRVHQERVMSASGFMVQLHEGELGPGQMIETEMAKQLGLKVFRLHRKDLYSFDVVFWEFARKVAAWEATPKIDTEIVEITWSDDLMLAHMTVQQVLGPHADPEKEDALVQFSNLIISHPAVHGQDIPLEVVKSCQGAGIQKALECLTTEKVGTIRTRLQREVETRKMMGL